MAVSAAAGPASSLPTFDIDSFTKTLTCSVSYELLREAVSLVPCMHKVNESVAREMFGAMSDTSCSKLNKKCPECRAVVVSYYPDHTIRDIVNRAFGKAGEDIHPKVAEIPAQRTVLEKEAEQPELPYPGVKANFVHNSGDWSERNYGHGTILRRQMGFHSISPNSLIKEFSLLGDVDNGIRLIIKFKEDNDALEAYLLSYGVPMDRIDTITGHLIVRTHSQVKILFAILSKHNEIPESHFEMLRTIVLRGTAT